MERFRQHLADTRREAHFAAHKQRYERVHLRQLTVASEGLAREVLSQIRDEGRSFTDLAAEQGSTAPVRLVFRCELPPAIAPPVFAARPHDVVGPLGTPEGFELLLIEQHLPATLDAATAARISQELFDAWLAERLRESPPELPILIQL